MASVFQGTGTAKDAELFKVMFLGLTTAIGASESVARAMSADGAVRGSPRDLAAQAHVGQAYELGGLSLYSGEDHLRSILVIFEGTTLPTYGLYTLLRSAAEAIVRCAYLTDPQVTETLRLARSFNVRLENLIEQTKATGNASWYTTQVAKLEQEALSHGIAPFRSPKDNEVKHFDEARWGEVQLFETYLKPRQASTGTGKPLGEMLFRYLSGQVHSMFWVKFLTAPTSPTADPTMSAVRLELNFGFLAGMLAVVLKAHEETVVGLLGLAGHPRSTWDDAKKNALAAAWSRYNALAARQAGAASGGP